MKIILLLIAITVGCSFADRNDDALVLNSYFGRGFGVGFKEDVLIKKLSSTARAKAPEGDKWMILRLNKKGKTIDSGIKMEFFTASLEEDLRGIFHGKTEWRTTVTGHEMVEESGDPIPLAIAPSAPKKPKPGSEWHVRRIFVLRTYRVHGKLIPD